MKKVIFTILFLVFSSSFLKAQTSFSDGFETGDFSNWNDNVGVVISNAYHHSGNYSAKYDGYSVTNKIVKTNSQTNYLKIDFYLYATVFAEWNSYFQIGGNGLVWYYSITGHSAGDIYNCTHALVNSPTIYFPTNYWNHITIERISTGFLYVWINGVQCVDGATIGTCPYTDITLQGIGSSSIWGGLTAYIDDITINYSPVGINQINSEIPSKFNLSQNYPNPFNPTTKINFDVPQNEFITLKIYDNLGKEIVTLVNEKLTPGTYSVDWNASEYPSGVYFYRLQSDNFTQTKRMILIK